MAAAVRIRFGTMDDADGIAALVNARDAADFGRSDNLDREFMRWWLGEDPDALGRDVWVAVDGARIVGFAQMRPNGPDGAELTDESCVHPDTRGRGIGARLLDRAEAWARDRGLRRMIASVVNDDGRRLLEERGFSLVRHFWRMEIVVDGEPPEPVAPDGIEIRPYRRGEDDAVLHALHQTAFAEHWDFHPDPLEEWLVARQRREDYDPALWLLACERGEPVGAVLAFGARDYGWILDLAVSKQARGRGIGLALLRTAFRELARRGFRNIGLEVDAANETGATRLYERAGMRVIRRYDTYEKAFAGGPTDV